MLGDVNTGPNATLKNVIVFLNPFKFLYFSILICVFVQSVTLQRDPSILVFKDDSQYEIPADLPDGEFLSMWIKAEQFPNYNQLTGED